MKGYGKMSNDFSVVIPNYNNETFLTQCVESIYNQTLIPKEIIIIDDCSTDNSKEVILSLSHRFENLRYYFFEKNFGVSCARNKGIELCTTKYITFLDSDDFLYNKNKYMNEMKLIENINDKYECLVYSPFIRVDYYGKVIKQKKIKKFRCVGKKPKLDLLSYDKAYFIPADFMVKVELLKRIGAYSFQINLYEDLDLLVRLSFLCKFYCTYEYGKAYRFNPNGLSKQKEEAHRIAFLKIYNSYYYQLTFIEKIIMLIKKIKKNLFKMLKKIIKLFLIK